MEFQVLLDSPGEPVKRIQIARLGQVKDPRYGEFEITSENVENWKRNLSQLPGGEALIDFEHRSERKPRDSRAAGWISGIDMDGDRVMADARWTPEGEQAIRDGVYRFMSPAYGPFTNDRGETYDDTLVSAALTNKPALTMPALMLASQERVSEAIDDDPAARFYTRALDGELGDQVGALVLLDVSQAERDKAKAANNSLPDGSYPINNVKQLKAAAILAASKHGNWQAALKLIRRRAGELGVDVTTLAGFGPSKSLDSRPPMQTELLKALGLDEDSDLVTALEAVELDETASKKLLDAATVLRTKADAEPAEPVTPDVKTLEQQAKDSGLVLLDATEVKQLQQDAKAGAAASLQLHEQRFDHAFKDALEARKVIPAERDSLHRFYELDADAAIKSLEAREAILPEKPAGAPVIELDLDNPADPAEVAASGVHPGSREAYRKVQARLKQLDKPQSEFSSVLEQMMADGEI